MMADQYTSASSTPVDNSYERTPVSNSHDARRRTAPGLIAVGAMTIGGIAGALIQQYTDMKKFDAVKSQYELKLAEANARANIPEDRILPPNLRFRRDFGADTITSATNPGYWVTLDGDYIGVKNKDSFAKISGQSISTIVKKGAPIKRTPAPTSYDPNLSFADDVTNLCKF
jgi:hypothetical protein